MLSRRRLFPVVPAIALALALPLPAAAEGPGPLKRLAVSRLLYETGQAERDALLVIAAAKLRKSVALSPADGAEDAGGAPLGWEGMLDTAAELAAGDPALAGLIEDVRAEAAKGVARGPVYSIARLAARDTDTYAAVPFEGQAYAEIYVEGEGRSNLDLFVHDAQNRLVCSDTDITDIAYCGWRPERTGKFSITVENRGPASTEYSMMTN